MKKVSTQGSSERHKKYTLKLEAKDKRYLIASLVLHLLVAVILFSSWEFTESSQIKPLPSNIQARMLSAEELQQLNAKKLAEQKAAEQKKAEARKKEQARKKERERKKKAAAEKKRKAAERKKAEAKKKEAARKKALIQKKEKERKEKEKKAKQKKEKEEKVRKERERKEQERKEKERKEKERLKAEQAQKKKEREQKLAERLKALDAKAAEGERLEKERQAQELFRQQQQAALAQEMDEVDKYKSLIYTRIVNRWHVPPNVRNKRVELQIRLLPTGELVSAKITKGSGHRAFDQSALNAAQSLQRYPVPASSAIFDKHFRQFSMGFTPPNE